MRSASSVETVRPTLKPFKKVLKKPGNQMNTQEKGMFVEGLEILSEYCWEVLGGFCLDFERLLDRKKKHVFRGQQTYKKPMKNLCKLINTYNFV